MTASDIRRQARETLKGRWGIAIAVALVASLLGGLMSGISFLPDLSVFTTTQNIINEDPYAAAETVRTGVSLDPLGLAAFIIGGVLQLGYAQFLLKMRSGEEAVFGDLFSQFHRFGQGFAQNFLRGLYTTLWSLLFVIPGILAYYSYTMTPFIMAENPDMTANEAIGASKLMMKGHRWELFVLRLSFIGWDLLAVLTLNLGQLALNPYRNAADAEFYHRLRSMPAVEG